MPVSFKQVLEAEQKELSRPRKVSRTISKLYAIPEESMALLKVPSVDQPVATLASSAIIPAEGEGDPKDVCDCRVEAALRKGFE